MDLEQYLEHSGLSPESFGRLIDAHGTTVRRWLDGFSMKDEDMVKCIEASGKKITAEALLRAAKRKLSEKDT